MQIGLSGLTGKQAPALRCFQCKGTLNLQGFHTLQLVSSPFLLPPSMHSLARQAPPWFTRCSPPPLLLPPPWHGAGLVHGHEAARPGSGWPAAVRGLPVPSPTGMAPQAWCRAACTQLSPAAVPTDSSSAAWRP